MNKDSQANPFRDAYDKASSELLKVIREFEQLRLQREHVEKVVNVLKPAAGLEEVDRNRPRIPGRPAERFHRSDPPHCRAHYRARPEAGRLREPAAYFTRTLGSTDNPGRSRWLASSSFKSVKSIRTGTRCTTLT